MGAPQQPLVALQQHRSTAAAAESTLTATAYGSTAATPGSTTAIAVSTAAATESTAAPCMHQWVKSENHFKTNYNF